MENRNTGSNASGRSRDTQHRGVTSSARPLRMAVIVPSNDDWISASSRMMENFSRIWGGCGNILIPWTKDGITEPFWRILEFYDPDIIGVYQRTYRHLELHDPSHYKEHLQQQATAHAKRNKIDPTQALDQIKQLVRPYDPLGEQIEISESHACQIRSLMSPWCENERLARSYFSAERLDTYSLDMLPLERECHGRIHNLDPGDLDPAVRLALASRIGALSERYMGELTEAKVDVQSFKPSTTPTELLDLCLKPSHTNHNWEHLPFGRTMVFCDRFSALVRPEVPAVLVVGDETADFCFALALDRMFGNAVWLPKSLLENQSEYTVGLQLNEAISDRIRDWTSRVSNEEVLITSLSLLRQKAEERVANIVSELSKWETRTVRYSEAFEIPLTDPVRILDKQASLRTSWELFDAGIAAHPLTPPLATLIERLPSDLRWAIDISVDGIRPPRRCCLSKLLSEKPKPPQILMRPSSWGFTYYAQPRGLYFSSLRPDLCIPAPVIRLPECREVFQSLFQRSGMTAELSSAGAYTSAAIDLWGGLTEFAADLSNDARNKILEAYRPKMKSTDAAGVWLSTIKRRFLSFRDILAVSRLGAQEARALLDSYVEREILAPGFLLHCPVCRLAGWYATDESATRFVCMRCRRESLLTLATWKRPRRGPLWFYSLAEVVFQAVNHDCQVPILALRKLAHKSHTFDYTPELDVTDDSGEVAELDICCLVDGRIVVGEAKRINRLGDTRLKEEEKLKRLLRAAEAATADRVVLATAAKSWRPATKMLAAEVFEKFRMAPEFLEDLSRSSP